MESAELEGRCHECTWQREGSCWYYMPDSIRECRKECKTFLKKKNINVAFEIHEKMG